MIVTTAPQGPALRKALVNGADLVGRLFPVVSGESHDHEGDAYNTRTLPPSSVSSRGFAMTLASNLVITAQHNEELSALLKVCCDALLCPLPTSYSACIAQASDRWSLFESPTGPLAEWCALQAKSLGGKAPAQLSDDSDDDDDDEFHLPPANLRGALMASASNDVSPALPTARNREVEMTSSWFAGPHGRPHEDCSVSLAAQLHR